MFRYGFKKRLLEMGIDYGDSILAAVSGGMDSMCMLDALIHCQLDLTIAVAHVNFNLRGQESDQDTQMVTQWCKENNITLHTASFPTEEYAAKEKISIEMAARDLRYNWFYTLMKEHGYNYLAIAHNANDNAETLLLNLTRGCGIDGIGGIREKVLLEEEGTQYIIRPLMEYSRAQIEKYALKFKVPYRVDSSNLCSDFSRNRIRNEVFPQLARINPSVISTFNKNIKHFQQAGNILQKHIEEKCSQLCNWFETVDQLMDSKFSSVFCSLNLRMNMASTSEDGKRYSLLVCIVELEQLLAEAEWEFWVYEIAYPLGFSPAIIGNITDSLKEDNGPKKFLSANGEIIAVKERGLLKFYLNIANAEPLKIDTQVIPKESWRTMKDITEEICTTLYMDADKVQMPLSCRPVEPGDRFSPLGLRGSKKVTDYLSDIKFEHLHKSGVYVLCDASEKIICIPGLQVSNSAKITSATQQVLQIRVL